jgi:drug/metabolite transporter (DMT)-like permease
MNRPLVLLIGTGAMLGLYFPIGKLALATGIAPALWAVVISLGAGFAMLVISLLEPNPPAPPQLLGFSLVSGFLSYVMPNLLTYMAIPHIGSGLASIMFALSPVTTALLSLLLRVRPPTSLGLLGIALGLVGAVIIILGRGSGLGGGPLLWMVLALAIPAFLGAGNVYRTMAWPAGASPRRLAATTNLAAVPMLLAISLVQGGGSLDLAPLTHMPLIVMLQIAVSTTMFLMFFRLQLIGGPTYLSQIGYVAAAVGLVIGVNYFHEHYPPAVWLGVAVVAAGIALSTLGQARQSATR